MKGGTIFTRVCRFFVLLVTILTITHWEWIIKHHQTNNNGYWIFESEEANFYHPAVVNSVVVGCLRSDVSTMHVRASPTNEQMRAQSALTQNKVLIFWMNIFSHITDLMDLISCRKHEFIRVDELMKVEWVRVYIMSVWIFELWSVRIKLMQPIYMCNNYWYTQTDRERAKEGQRAKEKEWLHKSLLVLFSTIQNTSIDLKSLK